MKRIVSSNQSLNMRINHDHPRNRWELGRYEAQPPNIYDLLYDAFELYTDQRKRSQIELIREVIFELKRDYNKEFDSLENYK